MQSIKKEKIYDFKLIAYFSVVMFLYIIGVQYSFIGQVVGCIAFFVCALYLVLGKPEKAFLHFILNLTFSIESAFFATGQTSGVVYSFIILPFITIYGTFALNILIFLFLHIDKKRGKLLFISGGNSKSGTKHIELICNYLLISGFIMLFITMLVNDNRIMNQHWYGGSVKSELFRMLMLVLTALNTIAVIKKKRGFEYELSKWMVAMLAALSVVGFVAEIVGLHGYRMGLTNVSALPLFAFFGIGLISFFKFSRTYFEKILTIVFVALLFTLMLIKSTPLGGKWFIAVLLTMVFVIYSYTDSLKGLVVTIAVVVALFMLINTNIIETVFQENEYMLTKYSEFKTIFQFAGNLSQSDASIAFRLDEIKNVWIEICKNPIYLLFGKGIVGTTLHHTNLYSWSAVGTFSEVQSGAGIYFQMHESMTVILLKYGMVGIIGFGYMLISVFRSTKVSPWGIIGFMWLLFYFGVYNSMLFGAVCLVLALNDLSGDENSSISPNEVLLSEKKKTLC